MKQALITTNMGQGTSKERENDQVDFNGVRVRREAIAQVRVFHYELHPLLTLHPALPVNGADHPTTSFQVNRRATSASRLCIHSQWHRGTGVGCIIMHSTQLDKRSHHHTSCTQALIAISRASR